MRPSNAIVRLLLKCSTAVGIQNFKKCWDARQTLLWFFRLWRSYTFIRCSPTQSHVSINHWDHRAQMALYKPMAYIRPSWIKTQCVCCSLQLALDATWPLEVIHQLRFHVARPSTGNCMQEPRQTNCREWYLNYTMLTKSITQCFHLCKVREV